MSFTMKSLRNVTFILLFSALAACGATQIVEIKPQEPLNFLSNENAFVSTWGNYQTGSQFLEGFTEDGLRFVWLDQSQSTSVAAGGAGVLAINQQVKFGIVLNEDNCPTYAIIRDPSLGSPQAVPMNRENFAKSFMQPTTCFN